jgi:antitoxin ParD1/3/4
MTGPAVPPEHPNHITDATQIAADVETLRMRGLRGERFEGTCTGIIDLKGRHHSVNHRGSDGLRRWLPLANFAKVVKAPFMATMDISLPEALKAYVDRRVEVIRKDQARLELRALLIEGLESPAVGRADAAYWKRKQERFGPTAPRSG